MTIFDIVFIFVFVLGIALILFYFVYLVFLIYSLISENKRIKCFKNIVIDIISKEDDKSALDIIYDEYSKSKITDPAFGSLIGKISTELRSGVYSKYYDKSIKDPMNLAKKLDGILRQYDDKVVVERFKQSELVKELGFELDERKTNQDTLMVYGKMNAYYLGRIHEKDTEIDKLKKKLIPVSIGRILAILGWVIGFVSGVLTIVSQFSK